MIYFILYVLIFLDVVSSGNPGDEMVKSGRPRHFPAYYISVKPAWH